MPRIAIIDSKIGNVGSVKNALDYLGFDNLISNKQDDFSRSTHIILPGVGSFPAAMENLKRWGLINAISFLVREKRIKFLGVCLGMQLLAETGQEGRKTKGLGLIKGVTRRFEVDEKTYRIPHVGWNEVKQIDRSMLLKGIKNPNFYFVHSFHFVPSVKNNIRGVTQYGEKFVSIVEEENVFGVQFHPEKSQDSGLQVLKNFCSIT